MISTGDVKKGVIIELDGQLMKVLDWTHIKMARGSAQVRMKLQNVRKGDTVITSGGLVGRVTKVVDDDQIEIELADGVRVRQMRQMVSDVRAKGEPVKDEDAKS